jgi:nitrate reductase alpha subunit
MGQMTRPTNATTGGPVFVDIADGKIVRIIPTEFDQRRGILDHRGAGTAFLSPAQDDDLPVHGARGVADGDLIRVFNDRGEVILAAQVTERVMPGVVHSYESCGDHQPLGIPGESPDRVGCVNLLTSSRFITPTSTAMAPNSGLVEVEKW